MSCTRDIAAASIPPMHSQTIIVLVVISDSPCLYFYRIGDLETAEEKYENAKKELEATLAELADV